MSLAKSCVIPLHPAYSSHTSHVPHSSRAFRGAVSTPPHQVAGVPTSRAKRLRTSWFVIGTTFGLLVSSLGHWAVEWTSNRLPQQESVLPSSSAETEASSEASPKDSKETPAQIADAAPKPEPIQWPRQIKITVSSGDTLSDILTDQGIASAEAFAIVDRLRKTFNPRALRSGHKMEMTLERDDTRPEETAAKLQTLTIHLSNIEDVTIRAQGDGSYHTEHQKKPVVAETRRAGGSIRGSFYLTAKKHGIPDSSILELIRAYSYDVDFQRDIQKGDQLELMYTTMVTKDSGEYVRTGDVLYAELKTGGKTLKIYRFTDADGVTRYYNEKGENVKKALLRTPVDGARISSGFGMRRHPVLGYSKMHKGLDFAAPTGTPIYAAGDGVIEYAGPYSSYGNYLRIGHNATYKTAYGHISRFAGGIRRGSRVHQGQVVAYVGATGRATGPHLHYEILQAGTQINPAGVKFAGSTRLAGRDYARFQQTKREYETRLAGLKTPTTKLASAR